MEIIYIRQLLGPKLYLDVAFLEVKISNKKDWSDAHMFEIVKTNKRFILGPEPKIKAELSPGLLFPSYSDVRITLDSPFTFIYDGSKNKHQRTIIKAIWKYQK